jgi:hypothetical protein
MNLIDERDASSPNPVHIRELLLERHCGGIFGDGGIREVSREQRMSRRRRRKDEGANKTIRWSLGLKPWA